jgi:hypothetical protein
MFNLGHTFTWTSVTVTDGYAEGFNEIDLHGYTTVSFVEGDGLPNL